MDNLVEKYNEENYAKANVLIMSKYRSSLLSNKIHAINIANADRMKIDPESGALVQDLPVSYYMEKMGVTSTSIYNNLKQAAKSMTSHSIGFNDPEEKKFMYLAFVIRAECSNGRFRTYYNPYLTKYLSNLQKDFTILNLAITLSFKRSVYSQRLYEIVRKYCFFRGNEKPNAHKVFTTRTGIDELKLLMGTVNSENEKVKRILSDTVSPDYQKAVMAASGKDKVLDDWKSFKKRALDPAVNEINDVSDITLEYDTIRQGRGGKIVELVFKMSFKPEFFEAKYGDDLPKELNQEEKDQIEEWFCDHLPELIHIRDIRKICAAAGYDKEVLREACDYMKSYEKEITNIPGFLIDAIDHNFYKNSSKKGRRVSLEEDPILFDDSIILRKENA